MDEAPEDALEERRSHLFTDAQELPDDIRMRITSLSHRTRLCIQCRREYIEIDNLGAWLCNQPTLERGGVHVERGFAPRATWVAADHRDIYDPVVWQRSDDIELSEREVQVMSEFLHRKSATIRGEAEDPSPGAQRAVYVRRFDSTTTEMIAAAQDYSGAERALLFQTASMRMASGRPSVAVIGLRHGQRV